VRGYRHFPQRWRLLWALLVAPACLWAAAGCSPGGDSGGHAGKTTSPAARSAAAPTSLPASAIGVSPGGITTRVDAPAESTEEEYFQACHAAKVWMDGQQADPKTLVEPYLQVIQAPDFIGPGSFNTPWAQLTPAQQAGVIMAVTGAANGECE
jgi:Putative lipoprotein LpqV